MQSISEMRDRVNHKSILNTMNHMINGRYPKGKTGLQDWRTYKQTDIESNNKKPEKTCETQSKVSVVDDDDSEGDDEFQ